MNRHYFTLMLCFFLGISIVYSQTEKNISVLGGYSDNGFTLMANYHHYLKPKPSAFIETGIYMGFLDITKDNYTMPLDIKSLQSGFLTKIKVLSSPNNNVLTSLGGGGVIGYEKLNNGNKELSDGTIIATEDGVIYGGYGAIETGIFLSRNIAIIGRYTQFYHMNSNIKKVKFNVAVGLKYYLF